MGEGDKKVLIFPFSLQNQRRYAIRPSFGFHVSCMRNMKKDLITCEVAIGVMEVGAGKGGNGKIMTPVRFPR